MPRSISPTQLPRFHRHRNNSPTSTPPSPPPLEPLSPLESVKSFSTTSSSTTLFSLSEKAPIRLSNLAPSQSHSLNPQTPLLTLLDWALKLLALLSAVLFGVWAPVSYRAQIQGNRGSDELQGRLLEEIQGLRKEMEGLRKREGLRDLLRVWEVCSKLEGGKAGTACEGLRGLDFEGVIKGMVGWDGGRGEEGKIGSGGEVKEEGKERVSTTKHPSARRTLDSSSPTKTSLAKEAVRTFKSLRVHTSSAPSFPLMDDRPIAMTTSIRNVTRNMEPTREWWNGLGDEGGWRDRVTVLNVVGVALCCGVLIRAGMRRWRVRTKMEITGVVKG